jgi:hypothetical protein
MIDIMVRFFGKIFTPVSNPSVYLHVFAIVQNMRPLKIIIFLRLQVP